MILVGLIVGALIGLVAIDSFMRSGMPPLLSAAAVVLFLVFLIFARFFTEELKVGLIAGLLLGILLAATPWQLDAAGEAG